MKSLVLSFLMFGPLLPGPAAFADARIVIDQSVLLDGTHARELDAILRQSSPQEIQFASSSFATRIQRGQPVYWLLGRNLGTVVGVDDPRLRDLGDLFAVLPTGQILFQGRVAAILASRNGGRHQHFTCENRRQTGSVGFPGVTVSICVIH